MKQNEVFQMRYNKEFANAMKIISKHLKERDWSKILRQIINQKANEIKGEKK
jgi:hypothetical protein